jgi:two-component SAPR family response regulator
LKYDVEEFEKRLKGLDGLDNSNSVVQQLEQALDIVKGDYLEGVTGEWCDVRRSELELKITEAMLVLADARAAAGQTSAAIVGYRGVLDRDGLREDAHRGLMRAFAAVGDRARALRQYEQLTSVLNAELGVDPDPETAALFREIRDEDQLPVS